MFIEIWVLCLLGIAAIGLAEIRYSMGLKKGLFHMHEEVLKNVVQDASSVIEETKNNSLASGKIIGSTNCLNNLIKKKLIFIDTDGTIIGYNNNRFTIEEARQNLKDIRNLVETMSSENNK